MRIPRSNKKVILGSLFFSFIVLSSMAVNASEISMISIHQLKRILDNPEIVVIDVRESNDWKTSSAKIKGAVRRAPKNFESWANDLPKDKVLILY